MWLADTDYRRKPKTININGYEVPEPLRVAPEDGTAYFTFNNLYVFKDYFSPKSQHDNERLTSGVIHLTKEAAELHMKALLSFTTME